MLHLTVKDWEIKCPYKYKDAMLVTAKADSSFCLKYDYNGVYLCLDTVHPYYYQVQCQLFVTGVEYKGPKFVQRVLPDTDIWDRMLTRVILFYKKGVLTEILGQWYTRSSAQPCLSESPSTDSNEDGPWCFCQQNIEDSRLIGCDKVGCNLVVSHVLCWT